MKQARMEKRMTPLDTLENAPAEQALDATIVDVTTESFMADVIEASQNQLVLLDLWAPWCEPCKQLTPVLEKLASESSGAVRLAKMDIDAEPAVAQQLQVQSIPAVFAFKDGQPVDGFMGVLPESDVRKFIEKNSDGALGVSPAEALLETARDALAEGQLDDALECYGAAREHASENTPEHVSAIAGLAQAHLASGNIEDARTILETAPPHNNDPELASARAGLALAEKMGAEKIDPTLENGADEDALAGHLAALEADPNDHQARFDLALAYHGQNKREAAMDALLEIIHRDKAWDDEAARKQLVDLFDVYGAGDELVVAARRRLSSLLFS